MKIKKNTKNLLLAGLMTASFGCATTEEMKLSKQAEIQQNASTETLESKITLLTKELKNEIVQRNHYAVRDTYFYPHTYGATYFTNYYEPFTINDYLKDLTGISAEFVDNNLQISSYRIISAEPKEKKDPKEKITQYLVEFAQVTMINGKPESKRKFYLFNGSQTPNHMEIFIKLSNGANMINDIQFESKTSIPVPNPKEYHKSGTEFLLEGIYKLPHIK